jgi:PST family polysaccharide transporter
MHRMDGLIDDRPPPDAVSRSAVRGVAWLGIERVVDQALAFAVFVVLGRLLDPHDFGVMAAATVVVFFLRVLVNTGFARALVQREELTDEHVDAAFWTSLGTGVVLALLTIAMAPALADLFKEPDLAPVVRALSVVFVLAGLESTQSALADRQMRFGVQAFRRFVASVVSAAVGLGLAFGGAGVWALVGQLIALEATLVVALWSLTRWRPRLRFSIAHFRDLFAFGLNYVGIRALFYLSQNADNFLIGWILGPIALGYYVIAYRVLFVFIELVTLAINQVALPTFSRFQNDRERLHETFYSAITLGATAGWPLFAGLALVADRLIPFVFGAKWAHSVPVMEALAITGAIQVVVVFTQNLTIAIGQVRNEFRWNLVATVVQVATFAATAHLGITAVALGLGGANMVLWPIRVLMVARLSGISPAEYARRLVGPALATAIMAGVVFAVGRAVTGAPDGLALLADVVAGAIAYLAALPLVARDAFAKIRAAARLVLPGRAAA